MDQTPTVSLSDAIATAEKALDGTHNGHPATLEFLIQPDGSAALTHVIQIQNESAGTWVEAFVDAHSNKVLSVTDFVAKSSVSSGGWLGSSYSNRFRFLFFLYAVPRSPNH